MNMKIRKLKIKKIISFLLIFLMIFVVGCHKDKNVEINKIIDIVEFDELINEKGVLKYDIRSTAVCEEGHIPSFMCMGSNNVDNKKLDEIIKNIKLLYSDKDKKIVIIDEDNVNSLYILNALKEDGYKQLFYFDGGYNSYKEKKGPSFVPEVGCNC